MAVAEGRVREHVRRVRPSSTRYRDQAVGSGLARCSWAWNAACSGALSPCWTMVKTVARSPRRRAAGSSHKPGKTVLRKVPSALGERGLYRPLRRTNQSI